MEDRKKQRRIFLAMSGALIAATLIASAEILLPFILGLLVAYVLLPAVLRVEQLRVPRWAAILIVYAITLGTIAGFIALVVPSLVSEGRALSRELPKTVQHAQEEYLPIIDARLKQWSGARAEDDVDDGPDADAPNALDDGTDGPDGAIVPPRHAPRGENRGENRVENRDLQIRPAPGGGYDVTIEEGITLRKTGDEQWRVERVEPEGAFSSEAAIKKGMTRATKYVAENMGELIKLGQQIVAAISRGIFNLFMTLMLGGYMMLTHERIIDFFRDLVAYESQPSFDRLLRRLDRGLSGVVRGQLIICMVNGVLSAIGFYFFGLKYWPILAFIAAVGSMIPIFGSIISTIPAVAIGLTQSPGLALTILAFVIGIHQLEANFLNPKIIGDSAKIHPVLVVFSLLVGEHFFQIKGALFAVPCLSILQTFFLHFREVTMGLADPMASIPPEAPARSLRLEPVVVAPLPKTGDKAAKPGAAGGRSGRNGESTAKGGVPVRPATPVPQTKQSRSTAIATTLPAGARIEDVMLEDPESSAAEAARSAVWSDRPSRSAIESTLESVTVDSVLEGQSRDTEPHEPSDPGAASTDPASSPDEIPVVTSSTPATVQPTGEEPPKEKPSEKG